MKNIKFFITGILTAVLVMAMVTMVLAEPFNKTITAFYNDIKITIDGKKIEPKNAAGEIVEPFIVDGTTYLPVRAIGEVLGYDVSWDGVTGTINLKKKQNEISPPKENNPSNEVKYEITNQQERIYESFREPRYETLIEIENTGTAPIYFGTQKYDLEDKAGNIIKTGSLSSYPDILNPGEKGYFYDSAELTGASLDIEVVFKPRWNIKMAKEDRINFDLSNIDIREGQFGTTVYGKISNNTGKKQTWAIISVFLYAKDGSPIGVWRTNVMEDMPEGASFGFEISGILNRTLYENVTAEMIGSYIAYAYPPQYQF